MAEWKTAGKVRMTPKGVHDSTIAYNILDLVSNEDHTMYYIAKQDVPANTLLTNTDYWDVVMDVDENVYTKSELDFKLPFGVESITVGDTILDNVTLSMHKDGDEDWYISDNISGLTTTNFKFDNYYILEIDGVSKLCRGEYLPSGYPDFGDWHSCTVVGDLGLIGKRCATPEEIAALPEGTVVHGGYYATFDNRFPELKFDDYCIARRFKNDTNFNLYTSDTSVTHTVTLKAATVVFTQIPSYLSGMNGVARYTNDRGYANTSLGNAGLQPSNKDTVYAEGIRNYVSDQGSHAEGVLNVVSKYYAHAEGKQNVASGEEAHVEGRQNVASGVTSHVGGMLNNDAGNFQTVIGVSANPSNDPTDKIIDEDNYFQSGCKKHVLVVGNGSMDYDYTNKLYFASSRSNAHTLDWHGNAEYAGDVKANACGGQNPVSLVGVNNDVTELKSAVNITANIDSYDFAYGNVYNGSINTDTNRIHTVDLIRVPKGAKLVSSAGFANMAIPVYTLDKKYKANGTWVTEYTVAEDCYIRLVLRKSAYNPNIDTSEFSTLAATISIYYNWPTIAANALQRIDDNAASNLSVRGLSKVMGIAHRGYMGVAPENTASAFVAAAKAGFAIVETDIRFTSDGVPVLIHDATVNRTSDGTGNVADMTLEQLKALDFGSWFGADFTGEKILTLSEGLALFKRLGVKVLLENKTWGGATDATMRGAIVDAIKRCDYADNVMIMYDAAGALANFGGSTALPGVPLILLQSDTSDALQERVNIVAAVTDDVYVAISYANATPEKVSTILGYGAKCIIYTVETASVITDMDMGISGVISGSLNAPVVLYNAATA